MIQKNREVEINFDYTAGKVNPDGIKAVASKVTELEKLQAKIPQDDIAGVITVLTGSVPYVIYVFTLTVDFTEGIYDFVFVESAPNVETSTSL